MIADTLLFRLPKAKRTGAGKWQAPCPSHDDRSPSLSIKESDDGRVLIHCHAGCLTEDVLAAVGLVFSDLFPRRPPEVQGVRGERRPWIPSDVFAIARFEVSIACLIACDLHNGKSVSKEDYARLLTASNRLERIAESAYGS
jgi:hypothetical protein